MGKLLNTRPRVLTASCRDAIAAWDSMGDDSQRRRTYRYRKYPTIRQRIDLEAQLAFACQLYNAALEQQQYAWLGRRHLVSLFEQFRDLTDIRAASMGPERMSCSAMRDPLRRVDRAFAAFFPRVKAGTNPGYPRFAPCAVIKPDMGFRLGRGCSRRPSRLAGHRPCESQMASRPPRICGGPHSDRAPGGATMVRVLLAAGV